MYRQSTLTATVGTATQSLNEAVATIGEIVTVLTILPQLFFALQVCEVVNVRTGPQITFSSLS